MTDETNNNGAETQAQTEAKETSMVLGFDDMNEKPVDASATQEKGDDTDKTDSKASEEKTSNEEVDYKAIELPEGFDVDTELLEEVSPLLKEHKFSADKAKELFKMGAKMIEKIQAQQVKAFEKQVDDWREECVKHPVLGNEEELAKANRAYKQLVPAKLDKIFGDFGLKNNPDLALFFHELGGKIADDKLVLSSATGVVPGNRDSVGNPTLSFDDMKRK